MRRLKTKLIDKLNSDELYKAYLRARRNKGNKPEVLSFGRNLCNWLVKIRTALIGNSYLPSKYRQFTIYDPKTRLILALPFVDRIIHQWLIEEFIKPYYIPRFIVDSYACIPGRGIHSAKNKLQQYMRAMRFKTNGHYYILKMDVSKFFQNIDLNILYGILEPHIADIELRELIYTIIFDDEAHDGLPIGNYVSQYFANIYLNELDMYCKHTLKIRYYVRYMDDFIILVNNRKEARQVFEKIERFLSDRLNLKLNPKSRYFPNSQGVDFIGYIIHEDFCLLRKRSKKKLKLIINEYETDVVDKDKFIQRLNSWYGHANHANVHGYVNKMLGKYKDLLPTIFK